MSCPCDSGQSYEKCCQPLHNGERQAATALELMRSRYCAFAKAEVDYIIATHHPDGRGEIDPESTRIWATRSEWLGFEVEQVDAGSETDEEGTVEFVARYRMQGNEHAHHETASFAKHDGIWFFVDSEMAPHEPFQRREAKVGRNDPCPCGSGKKYKKCCAQ